MTRLTKAIRQEIAERAVAHAFDPRAEALKVQADKLAREAYAEVLSKEEIKAAAKLPENWFRYDDCLRFNVGGLNLTLCVIGKGLPVPYAPKGEGRGGYFCGRLGTIEHGDLCDRIQEHAKAVESLKAEKAKTYRSVLALVGGVSTIKALREAWPEGEPFFKGYDDAATGAQLPAIRVDEVNAALGLA